MWMHPRNIRFWQMWTWLQRLANEISYEEFQRREWLVRELAKADACTPLIDLLETPFFGALLDD
jgi:hypothetical protein